MENFIREYILTNLNPELVEKKDPPTIINNKNIINNKYSYRYQNIFGFFIVIISLILGTKGLISLI